MRSRSEIATRFALSLALVGGLGLRWGRAEGPDAAGVEFFEKEIRPLLAEKCWRCHGDMARPKGGLRLTSRTNLIKGGESGPIVIDGDAAGSPLIQAVRYEQEPKMPPKEKLKGREIDALARWVSMGMPWPESIETPSSLAQGKGAIGPDKPKSNHWAFQPVKHVPAPPVRETSWPRTPLDRFILAAIEARSSVHAPPADRRALIRRATFDLTGLPPTPEEIQGFESDPGPDAFGAVVDRLLASPHYGERWGRHWLDVARYADARDLIQLPAGSDFRESWRYRDWVSEAFNRDTPYIDFLRAQLAGDLLPPQKPGEINAEGLVATGLLAIADFVPGDVDKDQMIADYVNDQIDVVGRAFMGLTIACARCHDHKFDPISTEDYYALAGIFFSTRLIPGPVPGNTPLVRVPLLPPADLAKIEDREAVAKRRLAELEQWIPDAADRAYAALLPGFLRDAARYLVAASVCRPHGAGQGKTGTAETARARGLHPGLLAGFVEYLGKVDSQPANARHPIVGEIASGTLAGPALESLAKRVQADLDLIAARKQDKAAKSPTDHALASSCVIWVHADDPQLRTSADGRVILWPNRSGLPADARPVGAIPSPEKASVAIDGLNRTVLRFDGQAVLEIPRRVPRSGTVIVVFRTADSSGAACRLLGWEDSDIGKHGVGLMLEPGGRLHAILRDNSRAGDLVDTHPTQGFEIACVSWGPKGTTLHRNGTAAGAGTGIDASSSDPAIAALRIGGPGSGGSARFRGDLAEVRVYDRQLEEPERRQVEAELRAVWFDKVTPRALASDSLSDLYEEIVSARGPFWISADERKKLLPPAEQSRLDAMSRELEALKKRPPADIPRAVVVQDGGPKGTRHEGFKDAHVFLRGNHKRLGKTVPRGVPRVLVGWPQPQLKITSGSGRLQLAEWLASADNPLTARVMVNRIWQHHFGEGLVRTPNDFGERGERPTHPELLDLLASKFVDSGWSVKAMHRLIMLSSTYQQSSHARADILVSDPENRLFGRMNRRRLDAESIRDSLLAVSGRLDTARGGPAFSEIAKPRRSVYLQSVRTGQDASGFGGLFDRADPGSIVARRGESVVAPQALFFMNDPFVEKMARALADRILREGYATEEARIRRLYALALGRYPSVTESELGQRLMQTDGMVNPWERYCHLVLCQNEFLYID